MITPNPQGAWLLINEGFNIDDYNPIMFLIRIDFAKKLAEFAESQTNECGSASIHDSIRLESLNFTLRTPAVVAFTSEVIDEYVSESVRGKLVEESMRVDYNPPAEPLNECEDMSAKCYFNEFALVATGDNIHAESYTVTYSHILQNF